MSVFGKAPDEGVNGVWQHNFLHSLLTTLNTHTGPVKGLDTPPNLMVFLYLFY